MALGLEQLVLEARCDPHDLDRHHEPHRNSRRLTSGDWQAFLKSHRIECSMSRRGNCHDNAVAESFFQLLKRERVRRKMYSTRERARSNVFDYIEFFYNPKQRHGANGGLAPVEYERKFRQSGVPSV